MEDAVGTHIFIPDEWLNAANEVAVSSTPTPLIILVCGAKNCGKTTFSRYLLDRLLLKYKRVAYLDTDVGQSEFTPPGFLSITVIDELTPDLTIPCLKTPERSYFFGDVSSRRDPISYMRYIHALSDYYRMPNTCNKNGMIAKTEVPLIVNTPGWVKGLGYDMLVDMIKYIAPTHVVKIGITAHSKNLPAGSFWMDGDCDDSPTLMEINSARADSFSRSMVVQKDARLLRDLRIMAYFRQCLPSMQNIKTIKELAHALSSLVPYEISIVDIKVKHLHCQVPSSEIFHGLNASIVGLAYSNDTEDLPECVGLGIVRGIDTTKNLLYVITPVPQSILENVDIFLQGFVQVPVSLLQVAGCVSPYMSEDVLPAIK